MLAGPGKPPVSSHPPEAHRLPSSSTLISDPHGAPPLIRRLLTEQGLRYWRKYAVAFLLMGLAAGCTALAAYLVGTLVNIAYLDKNFQGILVLGVVTIVLF